MAEPVRDADLAAWIAQIEAFGDYGADRNVYRALVSLREARQERDAARAALRSFHATLHVIQEDHDDVTPDECEHMMCDLARRALNEAE